jgi:hypothetical protein
MKKLIKFGVDVSGYEIPVLNEREVRAAAGLFFLLMFISIQIVVFTGDFTMLKYAVVIFLADMIVRVLINPEFSPSLIIGRLFVRNQVPEYVGAKQKKFAWSIGVLLAITMFILLVVVNSFSPITGIICLLCLVFLFFETAFGICLGCKFYNLFHKEKAQLCPGEVCDPKAKQDIQKTSGTQMLIVLGFATYIFLIVFLFNNDFKEKPYDLFGLTTSAEIETISTE